MVAPEERRPYEQFFRLRAQLTATAPRYGAVRRFVRERILNSLFFMQARWLVLLYAIQVALLMALHFDLLSVQSVLPVDTFLFVSVIGVIFGLLLSSTLSNVVNNSKTAMLSIVHDLHGKMDELASIMLPALNDTSLANNERRYEVRRYTANGSISAERISIAELMREQRDIVVTHAYLVPRSGRDNFQIHPQHISTLSQQLKNELTDSIPPEYSNNDLYLARLLYMYNERLDALHSGNGMSAGMQAVTYRQSQGLRTASGNVTFAASDLNQPLPLFDALLVTGWLLMIFYTLPLFSLYGFEASFALLLLPDLFVHGMIWFTKLYSNPFELSLHNKLVGVDIRLLTHTSVRNFDRNLLHALRSAPVVVK